MLKNYSNQSNSHISQRWKYDGCCQRWWSYAIPLKNESSKLSLISGGGFTSCSTQLPAWRLQSLSYNPTTTYSSVTHRHSSCDSDSMNISETKVKLCINTFPTEQWYQHSESHRITLVLCISALFSRSHFNHVSLSYASATKQKSALHSDMRRFK